MTKTTRKPARKAAKTPVKASRTKPGDVIKPAPRHGTKTQILISLLERTEGATAEELMAAAGWQKHSVQGFIAGTVKKKMGFTVSSEKPDDGPRRYRILKDGK